MKISFLAVIMCLVATGCHANATVNEPKTAASGGVNPASSATPAPGRTTEDQKLADSSSPPQPPAPTPEPPSKKESTKIVAEYLGQAMTVTGGETFTIRRDNLLYFWADSASKDCSNVKVKGLLSQQVSNTCAIVFDAHALKAKAGEVRTASIEVNNGAKSSDATKVEFKVMVK